MRQLLAAAAVLLGLAACSPEPADRPDAAPADDSGPAAAAAPPVASPPAKTGDAPEAANVLTLDGLGALKIGEAVPANSGWAERGAQISDECRTVSSPDFPGVYAIVEGGKVRRITVGERSDVKLAEGIGAGAAEAAVRAAFPGFRQAAH